MLEDAIAHMTSDGVSVTGIKMVTATSSRERPIRHRSMPANPIGFVHRPPERAVAVTHLWQGHTPIGFDMGGSLRQLAKLAERYLEEPDWVVESFEGDGSPVYEQDWFAYQEFAHCA